MRLASIETTSPSTPEEKLDGRLVVVSRDGTLAATSSDPGCLTMRRALDDWERSAQVLKTLQGQLDSGKIEDPLAISDLHFMAPLPRAADFVDGSGYLSHIIRVRKARGALPPDDMESNPLMYRGIPRFTGPTDDVIVQDFAHGADCEGELAVIVREVPAGVSEADAANYIVLVTQLNDISLRKLIPAELSKQFGFLQSKPPSTLGPFAATVDELAASWNNGRPKVEMKICRNGEQIGSLDAAELHFSLGRLISHAARTHGLGNGTIVGTGTVANADSSRGVACIAERVALDNIEKRTPVTPFFGDGEVVSIECIADGRSVFGKIENRFSAAR